MTFHRVDAAPLPLDVWVLLPLAAVTTAGLRPRFEFCWVGTGNPDAGWHGGSGVEF